MLEVLVISLTRRSCMTPTLNAGGWVFPCHQQVIGSGHLQWTTESSFSVRQLITWIIYLSLYPWFVHRGSGDQCTGVWPTRRDIHRSWSPHSGSQETICCFSRRVQWLLGMVHAVMIILLSFSLYSNTSLKTKIRPQIHFQTPLHHIPYEYIIVKPKSSPKFKSKIQVQNPSPKS